MKGLVLTVFCLLVSVFASAGTGGEDPSIAKIRSRFVTAQVPTADDLRLGQNWTCRLFDAVPGSFKNTTASPVTFVRFDGFIQEWHNVNTPGSGPGFFPKDFLFQTQGLVSVMPYQHTQWDRVTLVDVVGYLAIRVLDGGNLVGEWSVNGTTDKARAALAKMGYDRSLAMSGSYTTGYSICEPLGDRSKQQLNLEAH